MPELGFCQWGQLASASQIVCTRGHAWDRPGVVPGSEGVGAAGFVLNVGVGSGAGPGGVCTMA